MTNTKTTWTIDSIEHGPRASVWCLLDKSGERATLIRHATAVEVAFGAEYQPHAAASAAHLAAEAWDYLGDVAAGNVEPTEMRVDGAALGDGIVRFYHDLDVAFTCVAVHFGLAEELL